MTSLPSEPRPRPSRGRASRRGLPLRVPVVRVPRSTLALLLVSIVLPLALFALAAMQNRNDVRQAAELRAERTTRVLHEHALKVFETHQLVIDQINDRLGTLDWSDQKAVQRLHDLLERLRNTLPQVVDIIVTDANGNLRASSLGYPADKTLNFADRDYFTILKLRDSKQPYVSKPVIGRQTGEPIFNMVARVQGPVAGRFDGVIGIAISRKYFSDFYRDTEREYAHLVILAREDGAVLASEPAMAADTLGTNTFLRSAQANPTQSQGSGIGIATVMIDGKQWLFGTDQVGGFPVFIGFGVAGRSAMEPWWRNMWGYGLVAALSSLALLAVSGFAIRRVVLEGRATVRWRRSAALLETEMAERVRIEDQLRQSQKMEAVGRLTGGIAHDFNNLLTVVIGSLDLLTRRMKGEDERNQGLIKNAVNGATRAASLTSRLLAFSRQQPLDPKPLDVNALIGDLTGLLQRTLSETVTIDCRLAPSLAHTFADPNQLENALLNLCVNAADAMPAGGTLTIVTANASLGGTVDIEHPDLPEGRYVTIAIVDTGTGMKPEVLGRAFEPFYTTKPVGKGTGLGLSQVYGFARQSGGDVTIKSEPNRGTTVVIALPRLAPERALPDESAPPLELGPAPRMRRGDSTILLVEDEELVRSFSSAALRDAGYTVIEAGTGPDGLARLREAPDIALLFTDVVLKGSMNGRELAEAAEALRPGLPVLFTTGYTKDAIVHGGRLDEGLNFIGKPFTTAALVSKIEQLLDLSAPQVRRRAAG